MYLVCLNIIIFDNIVQWFSNNLIKIKEVRRLQSNLVAKIKEVGKEKGFTLSQIGEMSGVGKTAIYKWNKISPRVETLSKVANLLEVSLDDLLRESEN